jgi:hypothetical protein
MTAAEITRLSVEGFGDVILANISMPADVSREERSVCARCRLHLTPADTANACSAMMV